MAPQSIAPQTIPDIFFLSNEDPEWDKAWATFPDPALYNEEYGESLQYMGTVRTPSCYIHEFRHRAVPGTNQRQYWKIPATPGWLPRDLVMTAHLARLAAGKGTL